MSKRLSLHWAMQDIGEVIGKILKWVAITSTAAVLIFSFGMKATWGVNFWEIRQRWEDVKAAFTSEKILPKPCWTNRDLCDADGNLKPKKKRVVAGPGGLLGPGFAMKKFIHSAHAEMNRKFFDGRLAPVVVTLRRKKGAVAYYRHCGFKDADGKCVSEIAFDPRFFGKVSLLRTLSTLGHEACHQEIAEKRLTAGPMHNRHWAACMERIGLMPSHTGRPGGRKVGLRITHYIPKNSKFAKFLEARGLLSIGKMPVFE